MIRVLAPAKVNLWLRVLRKRPDGYHDIESMVQRVGLSDRITLREAPGSEITLECDDPGLPSGPDNLAWKAAHLLRERLSMADRGLAITLEKRIPAGAGLGGGSSDAAAVLLGLCQLWQITPERLVLLDLAASLGSDVPLFLHPSPSIITGRGETVRPVAPRFDATFLIVYPNVCVSTAWAYGNFRLTKKHAKYTISTLYESEGGVLPPHRWSEFLVNDLEQRVIARFPVVAECKESLMRMGARASGMSGSGSAVFGLFDDAKKAGQAAEALTSTRGWWAEVAQPLLS